MAVSVRFGAREANDATPFLGFFDDELAEFGWRAGKRHAAEGGKPRNDGDLQLVPC